jgi:hypothetical protein
MGTDGIKAVVRFAGTLLLTLYIIVALLKALPPL